MNEIIEKLTNVIVQENQKLRQEFKHDLTEENNKLRQEFKNDIAAENEKLRQEMSQKSDDLRSEMYESMDGLRQEVNQNMEDMKKEILDRQFVFENDYGKKIDAIFEYVQFHQKNNLKRFDRISDLEKRVEITEIHDFDHEKRISILERKKG